MVEFDSVHKHLSLVKSTLLDALAPLHCVGCNTYLASPTKVFRMCDECLYTCTPAPNEERLLNELYRHRISDETGLSSIQSLFEISDNSSISNALYTLKYKGCQQMAIDFGTMIGFTLLKNKREYDVCLPIPIHPARKRERGYNQSSLIALGIQRILNVPFHDDYLIRNRYTRTQTTLTADERFANISSSIFTVVKPKEIVQQSILLIDDVFTTGATLDSCATLLLESGAKSIHAATIASAKLPS